MSEQSNIRQADHVYVLMTDKYRISRNIRAQWYFNHLNKTVTVNPRNKLDDFTDEIEIVSILPSNYQDDWSPDDQNSGPYYISANTKITFFARRYRLAFLLDLSPSISTVDIQHNNILFEEVYNVLARCLRGLSEPFYVPGSHFLFQPEIFVTIIAHTPFQAYDSHQILTQGWKITNRNIDSFLSHVYNRLMEVTLSVSEFTAKVKEESDTNSSESDLLIGSLFEESESKKWPATPPNSMTSPDISMINMLRYGLLSLQLLPENSNAGIVIITDGMLSLPNANTLDSVLTQLRHHTISCSFLQIGSNPHPHSSVGFIPYSDLMKFISIATFGAYLACCPDITLINKDSENHFNFYHRAFFAWNFQRGLFGFRADLTHYHIRNKEWNVDNAYFYSTYDQGSLYLYSTRENPDQQIVRSKQIESSVAIDFTQLLSCRLREGYTIKSVNFNKNESQIEVKLLLPWRYNVNIEYIITSPWPIYGEDTGEQLECRYEVYIEGTYIFLHDVTCAIKKIKSPYRCATVKQFWSALKNLADSDKLEAHLNDFSRNPTWRNIPESIKNGVPLFYSPPNSNDLVLSSKNAAHTQFAQYWKQICMLDVHVWQKWMHTHRINIILMHDMPLPKNLFLHNETDRYVHIQCRQALAQLSELLKKSSDFILLENHSYIKLLKNSPSDSSHSFFMIRVILQPPSIVIHLAFIGGTSGFIRNQIVSDVKDQIRSCRFPRRNVSPVKTSAKSNDPTSDMHSINSTKASFQNDFSSAQCFTLMKKPLDKVLIRYEKIPNNLVGSFYEISQHTINAINDSHSSSSSINSIHSSSSKVLEILKKYMHHQRWVWKTQVSNICLPINSLSAILTILMKIRLQEGFRFAYNVSGIANMILELTMKDENDYLFPCVVQYIIFPPHKQSVLRESNLLEEEELEASEDEGELQLITECWIEPQHGSCYETSTQDKSIFDGLNYVSVAQKFYPLDLEAISCLLSYEYLLLMCQNANVPSTHITCFDERNHHDSSHVQIQLIAQSNHEKISNINSYDNHDVHSSLTPITNQNIQYIPFCFDPIRLLYKCQQAEITFPTLFQNINILTSSHDNHLDHDHSNQILFELFISYLMQIHDREIDLEQSHAKRFIKQIHERHDDEKAFKAPLFLLSNILTNTLNFNLKCFCKILTAKKGERNIVITIVPASYRDLRHSIIGNQLLLSIDNNAIHAIDGQSQSNSIYGKLTMPVYIYKTSFKSLSEQFLNFHGEGKCKNFYVNDHEVKGSGNIPYCQCQDSFLHFESNMSYNSNQESHNQTMNSSFRKFCQLIKQEYSKSVFHTFYKALHLGYSIDKSDISCSIRKMIHDNTLGEQMNRFIKFTYIESKRYFHDNFEFSVNDTRRNVVPRKYVKLDSSLRRFGIIIHVPRNRSFTQENHSIKFVKLIMHNRRLSHERFMDKYCTSSNLIQTIISLLNLSHSETSLPVELIYVFDGSRGIFGLSVANIRTQQSSNQAGNTFRESKVEKTFADKNLETIENFGVEDRKEHLWNCLFDANSNINFQELTELLSFMRHVRLEDYDQFLLPFLGMHITWYQGLLTTLSNKNSLFYRKFCSSDDKMIKILILHPQYLDGFILLSINTNISHVEINLVLKDSSSQILDTDLSHQNIKCHLLVEDFINRCAYYMWTTIN